MANYDDFELEEMENSAVDKSAMAKRVALGAGLLGAGAVSAFGAEALMQAGQDDAGELTPEDMLTGSDASTVDEEILEDTPLLQENQPHTEEVHVYHHHVVDQPAVEEPVQQQVETEPEITFDSTTHLYDSEGNLVGQIDEGTYDGRSFAVVDSDADGHGDMLLYDADGDGEYEENEMTSMEGAGYTMGHGDEHYDINIETGEDITNLGPDAHNEVDPYVPVEEDVVKIDDIENDWSDDKAGESYYDDLAENNDDYNNDGDIDHYAAGNDQLMGYDTDNVDAETSDDMAYDDMIDDGLTGDTSADDGGYDIA